MARGPRDRRLSQIVTTTLERMAKGGIYDQVGGGFARYSVDAHWLVPHFEKMLYDNALLARAYLHAWQLTGNDCFRRICEETLDWALREMRGPEGGFYSALDADSEGEEGRFYVWTEDELRAVLGDDADPLLRTGASTAGRTSRAAASSTSPATTRSTPSCSRARAKKLYAVRAERVWPGLDDKRLTAWNALMISALADAGAALGRATTSTPRARAPTSSTERMRDADGRLLRTYKDGRASLNAYLEDHAFLVEALLVLYEATFETRWFVRGARAGRRDRRALPRPGRRRLLHDLARPRAAGRAARRTSRTTRSRPATRPRPTASFGSRRSPASALRAAALERLPPPAPGRRAPPAGVRAPAPGAALPLLAEARGRARRRRRSTRSRTSARGGIRPTIVLAGAIARRREAEDAIPLLATATPVDGRPPATSARTSPATCRSPSRRSSTGGFAKAPEPMPSGVVREAMKQDFTTVRETAALEAGFEELRRTGTGPLLVVGDGNRGSARVRRRQIEAAREPPGGNDDRRARLARDRDLAR